MSGLTYNQKIEIVSEYLPGLTQEIEARCTDFGADTLHDTLRRMEGLGLAVSKGKCTPVLRNGRHYNTSKVKRWALTRDGEQLRDVRRRYKIHNAV